MHSARYRSILPAVVDGLANCGGNLRFWADSALVYDSEVSAPVQDFTVPPDYKKLSVQCYTETPDTNIHLSFSEPVPGEWKCVHVS